jgi:hypothetical protein
MQKINKDVLELKNTIDTTKAVVRENFIAMNIHIRKLETSTK